MFKCFSINISHSLLLGFQCPLRLALDSRMSGLNPHNVQINLIYNIILEFPLNLFGEMDLLLTNWFYVLNLLGEYGC